MHPFWKGGSVPSRHVLSKQKKYGFCFAVGFWIAENDM
jgi:hypothetical protein